MSEWREKDDLELTAEDIGDMLAAGTATSIVGPFHLPPHAVFVTATTTFGGHALPVANPGIRSGAITTTLPVA